jgi:predicted nucleotidyltransferase
VKIDYSQMDQKIIQEFKGNHPKIIEDWLSNEKRLFEVDSKYIPTNKQKKHQIMLIIEKIFGVDLSKKHYKLI